MDLLYQQCRSDVFIVNFEYVKPKEDIFIAAFELIY